MPDASAPGTLLVGAVDHTRYPQGLRWLDVLPDGGHYGYWAVAMDRVAFGTKKLTGRVGAQGWTSMKYYLDTDILCI